MLYLHSAGGIRFTYALDELAQRYRIYAMVSPGFDDTPDHPGLQNMPALADLAVQFAEAVIEDAFDLIGQSFGGFLSAWLTVRHPDQVRSLILQCPSGFRPSHLPREPAGTPEEMRLRMFAHPERLPSGEKSSEQIASNRGWAHHYHKSIGLDEELVNRLPGIEHQTLILQGTRDGMMPPESGQLLVRKIPRAKLVYVYDAGHSIEVDQPDRFVDLVEDFLLRGEAFIVNPGNRSV